MSTEPTEWGLWEGGEEGCRASVVACEDIVGSRRHTREPQGEFVSELCELLRRLSANRHGHGRCQSCGAGSLTWGRFDRGMGFKGACHLADVPHGAGRDAAMRGEACLSWCSITLLHCLSWPSQ